MNEVSLRAKDGKIIAVRLPKSARDEFQEIATKVGIKPSIIARELILEYIEKTKDIA